MHDEAKTKAMIELTLRAVNSISEVAAEAWDACANPAAAAANNGGGEAWPPQTMASSARRRVTSQNLI